MLLHTRLPPRELFTSEEVTLLLAESQQEGGLTLGVKAGSATSLPQGTLWSYDKERS